MLVCLILLFCLSLSFNSRHTIFISLQVYSNISLAYETRNDEEREKRKIVIISALLSFKEKWCCCYPPLGFANNARVLVVSFFLSFLPPSVGVSARQTREGRRPRRETTNQDCVFPPSFHFFVRWLFFASVHDEYWLGLRVPGFVRPTRKNRSKKRLFGKCGGGENEEK